MITMKLPTSTNKSRILASKRSNVLGDTNIVTNEFPSNDPKGITPKDITPIPDSVKKAQPKVAKPIKDTIPYREPQMCTRLNHLILQNGYRLRRSNPSNQLNPHLIG
jgi:hypothetical protein